MRPVQIADLEVAVRVLLQADAKVRALLISRICDEAMIADKYRKKLGRQHPAFGNGTLMSAAARYNAVGRPAACDAEYLSCLSQIIERLLTNSGHHIA